GVFVVALPYALLHTGYSGIFFIIISVFFCNYTDKMLISCIYEEDEDGQRIGVRDTCENIVK
ncbi:vesicular inhibitory amino acid transporter-like, partial [Pelobates cultripes]